MHNEGATLRDTANPERRLKMARAGAVADGMELRREANAARAKRRPRSWQQRSLVVPILGMHTYIYTCIYIYIYTHAYKHTYTHTVMCTKTLVNIVIIVYWLILYCYIMMIFISVVIIRSPFVAVAAS